MFNSLLVKHFNELYLHSQEQLWLNICGHAGCALNNLLLVSCANEIKY